MWIAASILLPAVAVLTWAGFAMAQVADAFRSIGGFEQDHFEIGTQVTDNAGGARWATPG